MSWSSAPAWSGRPAPCYAARAGPASPWSTGARWRAAPPARARATCSSPTRSRARSSTSRCCPLGCGAELADELGVPGPSSSSPRAGSSCASAPRALAALERLRRRAARCGVDVPCRRRRRAGTSSNRYLAPRLAGGVLYPQDAQVQPALAAARLLGAPAGRRIVRTGVEVTGRCLRAAERRSRGVRTAPARSAPPPSSTPPAPGAGRSAALAGVRLPVLPRRGFILVTEPLPRGRPAQGVLGRLRRQRRQRRRRPGDLAGRRGHAGGTGADRRQPRTGRLRPHDSRCRSCGRLAAPGDRPVPGAGRGPSCCGPTSASARTAPTTCRSIGADPRVPGLLPRLRARGRRHRPRPGTGHLIAQS